MKTKEEVNYRLPDKCCAKCHASYRNTYGDAICKTLTSVNYNFVIDAGGVCDEFHISPPNDNIEDMEFDNG